MVAAVQSVSAQSAQKPHAPSPSAPSTPHAVRSTAVSPGPAPAPAPAPSPFAAGPDTYAPHYTSPSPDRPRMFHGFSPILFGYGYALTPHAGLYGGPGFSSEPHEATAGPRDMSGSLYLEVEPTTAQVYVDGFYMGIVDDFGRTGVTLPTGRHRIELRASGYEALTIDVNIVAGQPTRYHGKLPAERRPAVDAVPPRTHGDLFVIPGCYAGDRPPRESALPHGCDIARMHRVSVSGVFCISCDLLVGVLQKTPDTL